jgi:broad specificity phosphatase PhoE
MSTIKRSKFQRKAAHPRKSAALDPIKTPPPSPEESEIMAAGGVPLDRGSSDLVPLSPEGQAEAKDTADKLAKKGGLDAMIASPSQRAQETAAPIVAENPQPLPVQTDPGLSAWSHGVAEGEPAEATRDQIRNLIRNNPSQKIPGYGAMSTQPGESFDDWRNRYLPAIRASMQQLAYDPTKRLGILTHSSGLKLTNAWLKNNTPDSFQVDPADFDMDKSEEPAQVSRLYPDEKGNWQLNPVDLDKKEPLQGGIYMIRHAATPWNTNPGKSDDSLTALAQLTKNTRALDFQKVKDVAQKAATKGHLSDDEITQAIDRSLPDANTAADLPHDQLMAAYAAASPAKRAEYGPLMQERFAGIANLPPDARQILASHLGRLGIGGMGQPTAPQV